VPARMRALTSVFVLLSAQGVAGQAQTGTIQVRGGGGANGAADMGGEMNVGAMFRRMQTSAGCACVVGQLEPRAIVPRPAPPPPTIVRRLSTMQPAARGVPYPRARCECRRRSQLAW
jgi:hypothetical protein